MTLLSLSPPIILVRLVLPVLLPLPAFLPLIMQARISAQLQVNMQQFFTAIIKNPSLNRNYNKIFAA
jgi:hypothetical protein